MPQPLLASSLNWYEASFQSVALPLLHLDGQKSPETGYYSSKRAHVDEARVTAHKKAQVALATSSISAQHLDE